MLILCLFCFLLAFTTSFVVGPFVIKTVQKLKAGQNILEYVEGHKSKQGTPTMCGIIFIVGTVISSIFAFNQNFTLAIMTIVALLGFACLGFLDDFLKIKAKHNEGLKPYQKIIGQLGISIILAIFVYNFVGSEIVLPFLNTTWDIGIFIIPLTIITTIALTNAVNLLDGLDGLCSGVSIFYLLFFALIMGLGISALTPNLAIEHQNLMAVCFCLIGALTAFEIFNGFPAKVFMGDTG
ncbi:MAG: phospho-N-acetylmuramoyl-pentapeptide-transferase, partial [Clostridia bacterium]|nr:phospho-N-acetylmuramoyl-pentapeptide-transferase [Clostridia bacterium]